ncbi:MAG: response regulator transcription factor [Chloroflexi bacterium]|nr:response regulator transcription factor [Chloroflexota bacterium]
MQKSKLKKNKIRVLLVDSHQIVRKGIYQEIEKQLDMVVVGETGNGYQALDLVKQLEVDVVILDIQLSGLDGVKLARTLNEQATNTKRISSTPAIIVFSSYNDMQYVWSF